ncbi:hypothetical protein MKC86_08145 [[Clostridium] innocuum]|nr:hypothetical protein [[Clostridium] innocuum]
MTLDGIIDNLTNALETWNEKLAEIWMILTQSLETFKGGHIWDVMEKINGALMAIGLALLVLFFVIGVVKTCTNFSEVKRPEQAIKLFLRFTIARGLVVYGMELMTAIFEIIQGITSTIMTTVGIGKVTNTVLPQEIINAVEDCGFLESIPLWAVSLLGSIFITILAFVMILTVYGRFFKLYMYTAISPIPLSCAAGETTQSVTVTFLKSYAGVCLEGAIIILSCIIFSAFAASPPVVDVDASAVSMVWSYITEIIFNMLILVGTVKLSDHVVKDMMGL